MKYAMIAATAVAAFLLLFAPMVGAGELGERVGDEPPAQVQVGPAPEATVAKPATETAAAEPAAAPNPSVAPSRVPRGEAPSGASRAVSVPGLAGPQGPAGPAGPQGPKGERGTTGRPARVAGHPRQYKSVQDASASVVRTYGLPSKSRLDAEEARQRNLIASTSAATRETVRENGQKTRKAIADFREEIRRRSIPKGIMLAFVAGVILLGFAAYAATHPREGD